jgi:hypothetical protein
MTTSDCPRSFCWENRKRPAALGVMFLLFAAISTPARDKTDVVMLRNGDRLTGEIIRLEYGQLEFKTDTMGTVYIEWPEVSGLSSEVVFAVEHLGGQSDFGRLAGGNGQLTIDDAGRLTEIPLSDVARMGPVGDSFLARIRGSASLGTNYTKASGISATDFAFEAEYRGRNTLALLSASVNVTSSRNEDTSQRLRINYSQRFYLEDTRFWAVLGSFERNPDLGIDSRPQAGLAVGQSLRRRPESDLVAFGGMVVNRETAAGSGQDTTNALAVAGLDWRIYRFAVPETTLTSSLELFPSLTDFGRVRARMDVALRRKFTSSLTLNFSIYDDYDNRPPGTRASTNDYGIVTGLGFTF